MASKFKTRTAATLVFSGPGGGYRGSSPGEMCEWGHDALSGILMLPGNEIGTGRSGANDWC